MDGVGLIAEERKRQIEIEGWTAEHDAAHTNYELSQAACCYGNMGRGGPYSNPVSPPPLWPWQKSWWKPDKDPIRNLVKAGALIAAEIDRLQNKGM